MPYANQMELVIILWLGFMGYVAYLGKEKANRLWVGMLIFPLAISDGHT